MAFARDFRVFGVELCAAQTKMFSINYARTVMHAKHALRHKQNMRRYLLSEEHAHDAVDVSTETENHSANERVHVNVTARQSADIIQLRWQCAHAANVDSSHFILVRHFCRNTTTYIQGCTDVASYVSGVGQSRGQRIMFRICHRIA